MKPVTGLARILIAAASAACATTLVAACGNSAGSTPGGTTSTSSSGTVTPGSTSAASTSPSAAATSPAQAAGPAPCATSALKVAVPTGQGNAAAGSSFYPVQLTNSSGRSCTLYGYPGVSFVTAVGGSQIGAAATRNAAVPRTVITLASGQTVHAELQVADAQNYPAAACGLVTAHWLKVYPPNQTAPLYASFTAATCSKPKVILSVQAVQSGANGT
ncbi:MAG TPA: DUF4232 domain-containing protein [Streptosporangiaceae bacterium]|nr:DUF4232 domain-containing protein [Streptosporangiaceae bacterium]